MRIILLSLATVLLSACGAFPSQTVDPLAEAQRTYRLAGCAGFAHDAGLGDERDRLLRLALEQALEALDHQYASANFASSGVVGDYGPEVLAGYRVGQGVTLAQWQVSHNLPVATDLASGEARADARTERARDLYDESGCADMGAD